MLVGFGLVWKDLESIGKIWKGLERFGHVWKVLERKEGRTFQNIPYFYVSLDFWQDFLQNILTETILNHFQRRLLFILNYSYHDIVVDLPEMAHLV